MRQASAIPCHSCPAAFLRLILGLFARSGRQHHFCHLNALCGRPASGLGRRFAASETAIRHKCSLPRGRRVLSPRPLDCGESTCTASNTNYVLHDDVHPCTAVDNCRHWSNWTRADRIALNHGASLNTCKSLCRTAQILLSLTHFLWYSLISSSV